MSNLYSLVGDIGGTNARLALYDINESSLSQEKTFPGNDYDSLESVIREYLKQTGIEVKAACIAIACPISGDQVSMTNHTWSFSIAELKASLQFETLLVINDFTAVAMAIPALSSQDCTKVGGAEPQKSAPMAVLGAGTGLGVAHLLNINDQWLSLPGEGGHADLSATTDEEDAVLKQLRTQFGHVSAERCLSGQGLVNLYTSLVAIDGKQAEELQPKDVMEQGLNKSCTYCERALNLFCNMMGCFAGNLALTLGTTGGVYIGGGIVPRFIEFFMSSDFRLAFEAKGRFSSMLENIPVFIIQHSQPGLLGSGVYLRQSLGYSI